MPTTCHCLTLYLILSDFDRIYVNFPASAFGFKLQTAVETSITAHKSNELNDKKTHQLHCRDLKTLNQLILYSTLTKQYNPSGKKTMFP